MGDGRFEEWIGLRATLRGLELVGVLWVLLHEV